MSLIWRNSSIKLFGISCISLQKRIVKKITSDTFSFIRLIRFHGDEYKKHSLVENVNFFICENDGKTEGFTMVDVLNVYRYHLSFRTNHFSRACVFAYMRGCFLLKNRLVVSRGFIKVSWKKLCLLWYFKRYIKYDEFYLIFNQIRVQEKIECEIWNSTW